MVIGEEIGLRFLRLFCRRDLMMDIHELLASAAA